jgi:hypothetical protein
LLFASRNRAGFSIQPDVRRDSSPSRWRVACEPSDNSELQAICETSHSVLPLIPWRFLRMLKLFRMSMASGMSLKRLSSPLAKLLPLRADQGCLRVAQRLIGIVVIGDLRQDGCSSRDGFRVRGVNVAPSATIRRATSRAGEKRTSSVLALNARPRIATRFPFTTHRAWWTFSRKRPMRCLLTRSAALRISKSTPTVPGEMQEGLKIFRKAEAAETESSAQELATYARV